MAKGNTLGTVKAWSMNLIPGEMDNPQPSPTAMAMDAVHRLNDNGPSGLSYSRSTLRRVGGVIDSEKR